MSRPLIYSPDEVATSPAVAAVISALPHVPRKAMRELCPEAADTPDALDLLDKLIVHSPRNRLTAAQACIRVFFSIRPTQATTVCGWYACVCRDVNLHNQQVILHPFISRDIEPQEEVA